MNTPDYKKLTASFLFLSVLMGTGAFLLSSSQTPSPTLPLAKREVAAPPLPTGAFVEDVPVERGLVAVPEVFPESALDSDNMTERLVLALGKTLAAKNPAEPDASLGLIPPSPEELVQELLAEGVKDPHVPLWEEGLGNERITVLFDASARAVGTYQTKLNSILETRMGKVGTLVASGNQTSMEAGAKELALAISELKSLPVPETLAGMHWALLRSTLYAQRALETGVDAPGDPLKAMVAIRVNETGYMDALQDIINESQNKTDVRQFLSEGADAGALTLLVPTAHAQWITFDIPNLGKSILNFVKKLVTEKLKDVLVHRLVQQTIKWIQGGGKPQFITNWKGFLKDSFLQSANLALSDLYPELCTSFGPLVRVALLPVDPDREEYPSCTIDRIVSNVNAFVDRFENGGWIAYGAALEPSNNFFGSLIQASEFAARKKAREQEAANNDAEASSGANSQKKCVLYDERACDACTGGGLAALPLGAGDACAEPCSRCLQYEGTTPGDSILNTLSDSFKAPLLRIVNAEDLVALFNALLNAALSKLVALGQDSVSKGVLGLEPFSPPVNACEGMTGDDLANCMGTFQKPACTETTIVVPVEVGITATVPSGGGGGGGGADCSSCGGMGGSCCGDAAACPGLTFLGIPTGDCPSGCYGLGPPPVCGGGGGGGGGGSVTAYGTGSGTVTMPNGANCTGGGVSGPGGSVGLPGGGGGGGASCGAENCGAGCYCDIHDGLQDSSFCFAGAVADAVGQARAATIFDDCSNGTGLARAGAIFSCSSDVCVCDDAAFHDYVASRVVGYAGVSGASKVGDELAVTGTCGNSLCSAGSGSDCPRPRPAGECMATTARDERYKLATSGRTIQGSGDPKAICPQ